MNYLTTESDSMPLSVEEDGARIEERSEAAREISRTSKKTDERQPSGGSMHMVAAGLQKVEEPKKAKRKT